VRKKGNPLPVIRKIQQDDILGFPEGAEGRTRGKHTLGSKERVIIGNREVWDEDQGRRDFRRGGKQKRPDTKEVKTKRGAIKDLRKSRLKSVMSTNTISLDGTRSTPMHEAPVSNLKKTLGNVEACGKQRGQEHRPA